MANEIQVQSTLTGTHYVLLRNESGSIWNGSAFVSYNTVNLGTYAISLTEQGGSRYFTANFPSVDAALYNLTFYKQVGGSPAEGDTLVSSKRIYWNGTAESAFTALAGNVDGSVAGSPTTTSFVGNASLSGNDSFYRNAFVMFTTGALRGLSRKVVSYTGATKRFRFEYALPVAPTVGDAFIIIGKKE